MLSSICFSEFGRNYLFIDSAPDAKEIESGSNLCLGLHLKFSMLRHSLPANIAELL